MTEFPEMWVDDFGHKVCVGIDPPKGRGPPIADTRTFAAEVFDNPERGWDARAGARLFAAAPALLAALWEISQRVAREGGDTAQADRAIREATGQ